MFWIKNRDYIHFDEVMFIFSMSFNSLKVKGAATSLNLNYQRILKRSLPHLMIRKLRQRILKRSLTRIAIKKDR